jgi:hypothetical protein
VTPPLASNKRLQKRRRRPTVFCPFQWKLFSTALHFSEKDTIDLLVGSICKQFNKIYANEDKDMKVTFWSNVAVSRNLAELCLKDHQKLG